MTMMNPLQICHQPHKADDEVDGEVEAQAEDEPEVGSEAKFKITRKIVAPSYILKK